MYIQKLGTLVKVLRAQANMKQKTLAAKFGIDSVNISAWEAERRSVPMKYFLMFPEIFQVNVVLTPHGINITEKEGEVCKS